MADIYVKLSELSRPSTPVNDSDVVFISQLNNTENVSSAMSISDLRELLNFETAFDSTVAGLNGTVPNQVFYVYSDSQKLSVNPYYNRNGVAEAITDSNGNKLIYNTINFLQQWFTYYGYSLIKEVPSFASLRTLPVFVEGQKVKLKSYYDGGNSGGGEFVGHRTTGIDDGGSIAAGNGYYWERVNYGTITPVLFGAQGNYTDTGEGFDNTIAFRAAVAFAIKSGYKEVFVPAGRYMISDEINLAGVGSSNRLGVRLRGENWLRSQLVFKASSQESACIVVYGGPGNTSGKSVSNLSVVSHASTTNMGIGLLLRNTCFTHVDEITISTLYIGVRLENYSTAGSFTEFCYITNARLFRSMVNIQFNRTGSGDVSFHGNNFINIQNQVAPNGGVGVQIKGNGNGCYLYNQYWQMQFFGGTGCIAIDLQGSNTDWVGGKLTGESPLIFKSDASSNFEFHGPFHSIGDIIYDVETESDVTQGRFVFRNRASKDTLPFNNALLPTGTMPRILPSDLADRSGNGVFPAMFHVKGNDIETLGFACYGGGAATAFYFGTTGYRKSLQDFSPTFWLNSTGARLTTTNPNWTLFIQGTQDGFYVDNTIFRPLKNDTIALGSSTIRFASGNFTNWIIGTNFAPRTNGNLNIGSDTQRVKEIFLTSAPNVTSDARKKKQPRNLTSQEVKCFLEISKLPFVWEWLEDVTKEEGIIQGTLNSGPTVQDTITVLSKFNLDWTEYSFIRYDEKNDLYSFKREDLLLWITAANSEAFSALEKRLEELESKIK